eukprot:365620-Chlamydomonas_euryale.AAC.1
MHNDHLREGQERPQPPRAVGDLAAAPPVGCRVASVEDDAACGPVRVFASRETSADACFADRPIESATGTTFAAVAYAGKAGGEGGGGAAAGVAYLALRSTRASAPTHPTPHFRLRALAWGEVARVWRHLPRGRVCACGDAICRGNPTQPADAAPPAQPVRSPRRSSRSRRCSVHADAACAAAVPRSDPRALR